MAGGVKDILVVKIDNVIAKAVKKCALSGYIVIQLIYCMLIGFQYAISGF
jgi:hypothetical protein